MGQKKSAIQKRKFTIHFIVNQTERAALAILSTFEGLSFSECMRLVLREALLVRGMTLGAITLPAEQPQPQPEVGVEHERN